MAPPFTLKLGSVDLAPYLRVGNDEGFDPYDSGGFEEPAFIDNPFGEGQGLANVDSRNREMAWPLYLNASTKDALHDLVGDINREIRYAARPLRVEWKDQDASASTFFDVEFARFDPNFRVRPSAQGWLAGVLRVWCKPYGHTGTYRVVGTRAPAVGFATFPMPSLAGDIGAHLHVTVGASYQSVQYTEDAWNGVVIAKLRPDQKTFFGASEIFYSQGSITAASGAIGTAAVVRTVGTAGGGVDFRFSLSPTAHAGRNRVLLLYNFTASRVATAVLYRADAIGSYPDVSVGETGQMPGYSAFPPWRTLDLGEVYLDPAVQSATQWFIGNVSIPSGAAPTPILLINGVAVLPEDHTLVVRDALREPEPNMAGGAATYEVSPSGALRRSAPSGLAIWENGPESPVDAYVVGALPDVDPGASSAILVARLPLGAGEHPPNLPFGAEVAVRERFTFAR